MRIVDFEDFCRMPAGTIFAPYTPCVLEQRLAVKVDAGKTASAISRYTHVFNGVMPLEPWSYDLLWGPGDQENASFETYGGDNNDYADYKMFLVFEELDIDRMINVLVWAKNGCVGECDCEEVYKEN